MWNRDVNTGRSIVLLIGQIFVLLLCAAYIQYYYNNEIYPDKLANDKFQEVPCFLTNKKLSEEGDRIKKYRADFLISYQVNTVEHNRWVSGNGLDMALTKNKASQEAILSRYNVGDSYICYYDPDNPDVAILVQRYNWLSTFPLLIPSVVGLITLYYFFNNLFYLISLRKQQ